jgi:uncharacterized protein (TIGR00251 family)
MMSINLNDLQLAEVSDGTTIKVRIQPRASRNTIAGIHDGSLKLFLTSPPVDGEANQACVAFLADFFGVAKKSVQIISGHKNRKKVVKVFAVGKAFVLSKLKLLGEARL